MNELKKWTIAEIADENIRAGRFYFSRDTLKHFGQRRSDFHVRNLKCGRVFVFAPGYDFRGKFQGISFAEFIPGTGEVNSRAGAVRTFTGKYDLRDLQDIEDYLVQVESWDRVKNQVYLVPGIEPVPVD